MTTVQQLLASIRYTLKYISHWPNTIKVMLRVHCQGVNVMFPPLKINVSPLPWYLCSSRSPLCCDNVLACWHYLLIIHVWELTTECSPWNLCQPDLLQLALAFLSLALSIIPPNIPDSVWWGEKPRWEHFAI